MTETAQILLVSVITTLTIILSLVGIQLVFVLKELKKSIEKANLILDDTQSLTSKVSHSTDSLSGMVSGIKAGLSLLGMFKHHKEEEDE